MTRSYLPLWRDSNGRLPDPFEPFLHITFNNFLKGF